MITADQLKDIKERTEALKQYLSIDEKIIQVEEEQLRTQAPGFWDNAKEAEAQMKKVKALQGWIDGYKEVKNRTEEAEMAMELYREEMVEEHEVDDAYARALTAVEELELKNMLRGEADDMDCVLKINSGAGGTEAQDWASMLMRMYMRWAEANGYKVTVANLQEAEDAGIKTVTLELKGPYAYGYLKGENGVHRLVRVSPFDASGRRHTSFASLEVMPEIDDSIDVEMTVGGELCSHCTENNGFWYITDGESEDLTKPEYAPMTHSNQYHRGCMVSTYQTRIFNASYVIHYSIGTYMNGCRHRNVLKVLITPNADETKIIEKLKTLKI